MLFIETSIFTKQIKELVSDEEYCQLQQDLLVQPDRGDLIKNGGGIRKYVVLKVTRVKVVVSG